MDRGFEFKSRKFKLSKLDAFKQFHIVRRIAPILTDLIPAMKNAGKYQDVKDVESLPEAEKLDLIAKVAGPVMSGFSKLSDADSDLVLHGLLSAVEVQQVSGNWARVSVDSMLMIQDLDLADLMQLAGRSFMFNLSGFFDALPR